MKESVKELSTQEIMKILKDQFDKLSSFGVKRVGLFGSFASAKQSSRSDIDLFVEFEKPSLENFMGLVRFLEKLFRRKVDIFTPAGLESIRIEDIKENIKQSIIYVSKN